MQFAELKAGSMNLSDQTFAGCIDTHSVLRRGGSLRVGASLRRDRKRESIHD